MSVEDIINEIQKRTGKSKSEISDMMDAKHDEFSGMITKEAAGLLVARELGITMPNNGTRMIQISNIFSGMRNINTVGRVFRISPVNQFEKKNGEAGRVVNIFIGDSTGFIRIPLWNDQVRIIEENIVKMGDVIQVSGGLSKENNFGDVEISLGKFGTVKALENESGLPSLDYLMKKYFADRSVQRILIRDAIPGTFEFKATVSQIFRGRFLFDSGSDQAMIISCILDDGSATMRAVMFRDVAEKACGLKAGEISSLDEQARYGAVAQGILGKEFIVSGRVKNNEMSGAMEIIANDIKNINPLDESKRLLNELETLVGA